MCIFLVRKDVFAEEHIGKAFNLTFLVKIH